MTKVSTAANAPPILHISTARAHHTAAGSGRLEKLGDAFFHPLRVRKLRAGRVPSSCEKVGKKKRTHAKSFSPFQAWWPSEHCRFKNSLRGLFTTEATTLLSAEKPLQSENYRTDVASASRESRTLPPVAAADGTTVPVRLATAWPNASQALLRRSQLLVVLCLEEFGSSQIIRPWRCPTRSAESPPFLLARQ